MTRAEVAHLAYLGLGSNLGERATELGSALERLAATPSLSVRRVSSFYESAPLGPVRRQPGFLNAVAEVETALEPRALLARCLEVEVACGRVRAEPKGPRRIDLDLLLFDDWVCAWPELVLPHPELTHRAFVLCPLLELEPELCDPRTGRRLSQLWSALEGTQEIRRV